MQLIKSCIISETPIKINNKEELDIIRRINEMYDLKLSTGMNPNYYPIVIYTNRGKSWDYLYDINEGNNIELTSLLPKPIDMTEKLKQSTFLKDCLVLGEGLWILTTDNILYYYGE